MGASNSLNTCTNDSAVGASAGHNSGVDNEERARNNAVHSDAQGDTAAGVDNEGWVRVNAAHLDARDPTKTFHYVITHHPQQGMGFRFTGSDPKSWVKNATHLPDIAKYADAVTVCCYEHLGTHQLGGHTFSNEQLNTWNTTAIANMAYIAIHHSDRATRNAAESLIRRWQALH